MGRSTYTEDIEMEDFPAQLVTFGETLGLLTADTYGPLRFADKLRMGFGGCESNVALGAVRLGVRAAWMGRVGDDEFGRLILTSLRGEGVDVSAATVDTDRPTALMFKELRTRRERRVSYYRRGSAASRLHPDHIDLDSIRSADELHVSAITTALSRSAREAVFAAVEEARLASTKVSVDLNYRSALWNIQEAKPTMRELCVKADTVFASAFEANIVTELEDPTDSLNALGKLGGDAIIKLGDRGAIALIGNDFQEVPPVEMPLVDPVGAGDAFAAGYLTACLQDFEPRSALARAALCGAYAVTVPGDWEGYPTSEDLERRKSAEDVHR